MLEYVRGSEGDKWHWCKNCTQYPMYIYQKTSKVPPSELCDQCKTKTKNENCQCEELNVKKNEHELQRVYPEFSYPEFRYTTS